VAECRTCGEALPLHRQYFGTRQIERKSGPQCRKCAHEAKHSNAEAPKVYPAAWPPPLGLDAVNRALAECDQCGLHLPHTPKCFRKLSDGGLSSTCHRCLYEGRTSGRPLAYEAWPPPFNPRGEKLVTCNHDRGSHRYATWKKHFDLWHEEVVECSQMIKAPPSDPAMLRPDYDWSTCPQPSNCASVLATLQSRTRWFARAIGAAGKHGVQAQIDAHVHKAFSEAMFEGGLDAPGSTWKHDIMDLVKPNEFLPCVAVLAAPPESEPCGLALPFTAEFWGAQALRTKRPEQSKAIKCRRCENEARRALPAPRVLTPEQQQALADAKARKAALRERKVQQAWCAYIMDVTFRWGLEQDPDKA
jgi:hypothetical protein